MALVYVDSNAAGAGTGADWANAYTTLAAACAAKAAGDTFYVAHNHAETQATAMTNACPGTLAAPCKIICVNSAGTVPPVSADLRTTATITTTGASSLTNTGHFYCYGIDFSCGTGAVAADFVLASATGNRQIYDLCKFRLLTTNNGRFLQAGTDAIRGQMGVRFIGCQFRFGSAAQGVYLYGNYCRIQGGSIIAGGSNLTGMFFASSSIGEAVIDGFDFSNFAVGFNFLANPGGSPGAFIFRNCKLPASWSGGLFATAPPTSAQSIAKMYNCSAGDTNYELWIENHFGSIKSETILVKTGGATDGDTPLSWKMASAADAEYTFEVLRSPEIFSERITTVGSPVTITVDILHDTNVAAGQGAGTAFAFQDDEIWLEVQYLGTSGFPLALFGNDCKADVLATAADQASSSAAWTTTGMTTPVKQKLEVTFTPQEEGVAIVTVCVAKASKTIYVDPFAQLGTSGTSLSFMLPGAGITNVVVPAGGGGGMRVIGG